jgi:membrane-bound lytic murein transglycosylase F
MQRGRVARGIALALILGLVIPTVNASSVRVLVYDASIRKWASVYTPEYPWYWNKAQLVAESNLNPNARSPVGAMGLGQFMPDTWAQMQRELGLGSSVSAYTSSASIQAQAYYMRQLRRQFRKPRPEVDKHSLALASYNAGLGNILKAQQECGNSLLYKPMIEALPKVTGRHSVETTNYVQRIWRIIKEYE